MDARAREPRANHSCQRVGHQCAASSVGRRLRALVCGGRRQHLDAAHAVGSLLVQLCAPQPRVPLPHRHLPVRLVGATRTAVSRALGCLLLLLRVLCEPMAVRRSPRRQTHTRRVLAASCHAWRLHACSRQPLLCRHLVSRHQQSALLTATTTTTTAPHAAPTDPFAPRLFASHFKHSAVDHVDKIARRRQCAHTVACRAQPRQWHPNSPRVHCTRLGLLFERSANGHIVEN